MKRVIAMAMNRRPTHEDKPSDYEKTAAFLVKNLTRLGWEVVPFEVGSNLSKARETLREIRPEVVFNLVDAFMDSGEMAHFMTLLFPSLRLPFTGVDSTVFSLVNDKLTTKWHLLQAGLPTPQGADATALVRNSFPGSGPYIIKSRFDHSSKGLDEESIVNAEDSSDLLVALKDGERRMGMICIAEQYLEGAEYSVSVLESAHGQGQIIGIAQVFLPQETGARIVDYKTLWKKGRRDKSPGITLTLKNPGEAIFRRIERLSLECWEELGLCGYARFVFRTDKSGNLNIIDVVTNPSLAEKAAFLNTASLNGWTPEDVVSSIVEGAIARHSLHL